jgi:D-lactate dehydrogenase (cytochrome)
MLGVGRRTLRSVRPFTRRRGWTPLSAVFANHRPLSSLAESSRSSHIRALQEILPHVDFSENPYVLERHGRGESFHPTRRPDAVVTPSCVDDVVKIMSFCVRHRIPIVPFGAGTSVEGHVNCLSGGISLDMGLFQDIEIPDITDSTALPDPIAKVGAGVTRKTLTNALRHTGMQFVVDPGADATLGGMVATGASGTTAVRYGTMRENILEVECVLPDEHATIVHAGTRALKNSAGYDLLSLLCGSEGTLGVITSVTVKLHPIPEHVVAAVCAFDSLKEAAQAVAALKLCEVPLVRCELLDATSVAAFNAYQKDGLDHMEVKPTLFLEFQGATEESIQGQVKMTESICTEDYGGSDFNFTSGEEERKALWSARHNLYYASLNLRPGSKDAILTDACVPLSKFAELIEATARDVEEKGVVGPCFGHAADGNFHCILPVLEDDSEEYKQKLHEVNSNLIRRTLEVGGTCTGEHGVGYGKIKYLERQYGPGAVQMMKSIKTAIDKCNIMNPGKVVPM